MTRGSITLRLVTDDTTSRILDGRRGWSAIFAVLANVMIGLAVAVWFRADQHHLQSADQLAGEAVPLVQRYVTRIWLVVAAVLLGFADAAVAVRHWRSFAGRGLRVLVLCVSLLVAGICTGIILSDPVAN